ncbi:hypothetical protein, partial [Streptomyces radiopugnans]|uniref:hypothetical protein n=1 Tax=Streptomyces radiopugnans TaxID=403935 RepID=UPI003F1BA97E
MQRGDAVLAQRVPQGGHRPLHGVAPAASGVRAVSDREFSSAGRTAGEVRQGEGDAVGTEVDGRDVGTVGDQAVQPGVGPAAGLPRLADDPDQPVVCLLYT